jgi:hypothetical protein
MAWTRVTSTSLAVTLANQRNFPGAMNFNQMTGINWNDSSYASGSSFKTNAMSDWFRDDGSTTT